MSLIRNKSGIQPVLRDEFALRDEAMSGDLVWVVTPATVDTTETGAAWTRSVHVELQNAAGDVHEWFTDTIASGNSIADDGGGTATIVSVNLAIVNGKADVVVSGGIATWAADETDTYTVTEATILGYTVAAVTSVETFVAA